MWNRFLRLSVRLVARPISEGAVILLVAKSSLSIEGAETFWKIRDLTALVIRLFESAV